MDKTSVIGILLGMIAIGIGIWLKGVSLLALINPAALLIIFIGTAASVLIAFPMRTIKNVPQLLRIIFTEEKHGNMKQMINQFTAWAELTRREGLLALEGEVEEVDDPFLHSGLQLAIDGQTPDFIREVMLEKIDAMEKRHAEGAAVFSQAGTYAPTLGVLGAVVGLIAALGNMQNMELLGSAISAAFIATLLGIFTGYVLWHPFANKLREKSKNEVQIKEVMVEGILSLTTGDSPLVIKDKLSSYLSSREIKKMEQEAFNETEETE
ncbi:flagellar motor stator protein MotA [Virgibacillus sp. W0430]|uniref:flagellar motor stator protein MotA n=1 Tax=Virgibacillus sp. W0430 TaxID=3391580 RepID=UPI003F463174